MKDVRKVIVLSVALVVIVVGGLFVQRVQAPSDNVDSSLVVTNSGVAEFKQQLEARVRREIGQPIEGYTPDMFLRTFPGLQPADFDGVEAMIGQYTYVNGTLIHDLGGKPPTNSAAASVTEKGIETLLSKILNRLGNNNQTVEELLNTLLGDQLDSTSFDPGQPTTPANPNVGGDKIEIYDGVFVPQLSQSVDLSGKGLTGSLKAEIRLISKLEYLDLSDNNFTGLPAEVGQLSQLKTLNLRNNKFTGLPQELGNLSNLTYLNLSGNDVSEFDLNIIKDKLTNTNIITDNSKPVACTMDAKICPDGSAVGRVGPDCEFAACPASTEVICTETMKQAQACTLEYAPVCGLVQVQCITTPCDPVPETFSNGCAACARGNVISYTEGECKL